MAAAAPILLAAGTGVGIIGQLTQMTAMQRSAEYNAQVAQRNADLVQAQAREDEKTFRIQSRKQLGDIRANYGASGVTMDGSALDVLEESAATAEMDALRIKHGGIVKAAGLQSDAALYGMQGSAARAQGIMSASSTLLNSVSKGYDKGYFKGL